MMSKKIARKLEFLEFMDFLEFMGEIDGADRKAFAEGGSCTMGIRIGRGKSMHELTGNLQQSSLLNLCGETLL